ncbi:MAG TPA: hypothetical protein VHF92_05720 [Geodermatophilus sp.]|nr:hypothetical protein [Geodermatophilus sp.]
MRFLLAAALAALAVVSWGVSYRAAGVQFREPLDVGCFEHAPAGWHEATDAEATLEDLPPRLHCSMTHSRTGEVATWDSGAASLPAFVVSVLAGLAFLVALGSGLVHRARHRSR